MKTNSKWVIKISRGMKENEVANILLVKCDLRYQNVYFTTEASVVVSCDNSKSWNNFSFVIEFLYAAHESTNHELFTKYIVCTMLYFLTTISNKYLILWFVTSYMGTKGDGWFQNEIHSSKCHQSLYCVCVHVIARLQENETEGEKERMKKRNDCELK